MIRVLVMDDDVYVGRLHRDYVGRVPGFEALEPVRDLRSARAVLAEGPVDLVLADLVLPDGSGVDLIRELSVDAAILSAVTDAAVVREALTAGALTYIFKPFEPERLTAFLRRYARLRRLWDRERLTQADVDRALRGFYDTSGSVSGGEGSGGATATSILETLRDAGEPVTAAQAGEAAGVSRATAQRHLARMAQQHAVVVTLRYGSAGRPEHLYSTRE